MYELKRRVLLALPPVLGVDFSITNETLLLWLAALITFVVLRLACRRRNVVPQGAFENVIETVIEFIEREIVRENIGPAGRSWSSFILTLFFFILFCNLMGLIPLPSHVKAVTSNLSVTTGLAAIVFLVAIAINIKLHGVLGFLRKFWTPGIPWWVAAPMVPLELISWLVRPITLAIRLFVNMMVGHHLLFLFIGFEMVSAWYLKTIPFLGAVLMTGFELFVCFIQAFVFTILAAVYIRDAMEAH